MEPFLAATKIVENFASNPIQRSKKVVQPSYKWPELLAVARAGAIYKHYVPVQHRDIQIMYAKMTSRVR
jgi:hypothetical protein